MQDARFGNAESGAARSTFAVTASKRVSSPSHSRTMPPLRRVSCVLNVFDTRSRRCASDPAASTRCTAAPSTFDRKCTRKRPGVGGDSASTTKRGPRSERRADAHHVDEPAGPAAFRSRRACVGALRAPCRARRWRRANARDCCAAGVQRGAMFGGIHFAPSTKRRMPPAKPRLRRARTRRRGLRGRTRCQREVGVQRAHAQCEARRARGIAATSCLIEWPTAARRARERVEGVMRSRPCARSLRSLLRHRVIGVRQRVVRSTYTSRSA